MTAHPFLAFPIRGQKDAIRVRHRARQIASLLRFSAQEQACIAAGTFHIACQALEAVDRFRLCFQIGDNQLHVFARCGELEVDCRLDPIASEAGIARVMRLSKTLPDEQAVSPADLAWLVCNSEENSAGLFEEMMKQNQEVLSLLHELVAFQKERKQEQNPQPSAA